MKKKIIVVLVALSVLVLAGAGIMYYRQSLNTNDLQQKLGIDLSTVDKVVVQSGATGKTKTLTSKKDIQKFLGLFRGTRLRQTEVHSLYVGYRFGAALYQGDQYLGGFLFGDSTIRISQSNNTEIVYSSSKKINNTKVDRMYGLERS